MMQRWALFTARTAVTAWVGAAVLFVVVGISEVVHPGFDSMIRDQLVLIRFPWFYRCGFALVIVGLCGTLAASAAELTARGKKLAATLLFVALLLMVLDYFAVFQPLIGMITPPGRARPSAFMIYHRLSMWVNLAQLLCSFAAAGVLNWPRRPVSSSERKMEDITGSPGCLNRGSAAAGGIGQTVHGTQRYV